MIKLQIIGTLVADAELANVNGAFVLNFTLLHSEKYIDPNVGERLKSTKVSCNYWTSKIDLLPELKERSLVYAEGYPKVLTYTNTVGGTSAIMKLKITNLIPIPINRPVELFHDLDEQNQ